MTAPRQTLTRTGLAAFGGLVALVLAAPALRLAGQEPLVVRSGSMAPALAVGDLAVVRAADPAQVRAGDVVTFRDPSRGGMVVTHRVTSVVPEAGGHVFLTKGDRNDAVEQWSVRAGEPVARLAWSVPRLGFAAAFVAQPGTRVAVAALAVFVFVATRSRVAP